MPTIPKLLTRTHVFMYRLTSGLLGGRLVGAPVLLLTTTGRGSGKAVTSPLLYLMDGNAAVVIAPYGGHPTHPDWYLNLRKNPRCTVQIRRRRSLAQAETLDGAERGRLWDAAVRLYGPYADYQRKTTRQIPVVRLHPEVLH